MRSNAFMPSAFEVPYIFGARKSEVTLFQIFRYRWVPHKGLPVNSATVFAAFVLLVPVLLCV